MMVEGLEGRVLCAAVAKFATAMVGAAEVPPVTTLARGTAKFVLSRDGLALRYTVKASRISNVSDAHIHLGPAGADGQVVAHLMDPATTKVGRRKVTMRGVITAASLAGPMAGMTLADLVTQMSAGATYVNVHTDDGVAPPGTGPGDFPGGEIRGQIRRLGRQFQGNNPIIPGPGPQY